MLLKSCFFFLFPMFSVKGDDHRDLFHFDDFQSCIDSDPDALYCLVFMKLHPQNYSNVPNYWKHIQEISKPSHRYDYSLPVYGVCKNHNETIEKNIEKRLGDKYAQLGVGYDIEKTNCQGRNQEFNPKFYDRFLAFSACAYVLFTLYVTIFGSKNQLAKCFDLKVSWRNLTSLNHPNEDHRKLQGLHGVRVTGLVAMLIVHVKSVSLSLPGGNPEEVEKVMESNSKFLFFSTGGHGLSTWFAMSILLLTYHTFKFFDEHKNFSVKKYITLAILTRYFRLVPLMLVVMAFHSSVWFKNVSTGIYWDYLVGEEYRKCNKGWLKTLLFHRLERPSTDMCQPQAWSMEIDMKFYLIMLFVVVLIRNRKYLVFPISAILFCVYVYDKFTKIYRNKWRHAYYAQIKEVFEYKLANEVNYHWIHMTMLPHLPGVVSGLLIGYFYYRHKDLPNLLTKKIYADICKAVVNFIAPMGILIANLLNPENQLAEAIFGVVDGLITPIMFCVGTIGLVQGLKAWNTIYDHPFWQILGRLTYAGFLCHMTFIRWLFGSSKTPLMMSLHLDLYILVVFVLSLLAAVVLAVLVEIPLGKFAKVLLENGVKAKKLEKPSEKPHKS